MNGTALLIIAIAFAILVLFLIIFIVRSLKILDETHTTIAALREESLATLAQLRTDTDITLRHTNEILAKTSVLVDDINGKMEIVEPLFVAVADLSESVSDLNSSARGLTVRANRATKSTVRAGKTLTLVRLASKLFKK